MNKRVYIIIFIVLFFSCKERKSEEKEKKVSISKLKGDWNCGGENSFYGITKIISDDTVILGLSQNNIWINTLIKQNDSIKNTYNLYYNSPRDLGRGGMHLDWENYSKKRPFAIFRIVNDSVINKTHFGFYNKIKKEYEDWSIDWNMCDTLYKEY